MRPREQVGMCPSQRRRGGGRVRRPDGRQEQQLRRIAALAEAVEDVDRGRVRPLNILDPQDERRVFGQGLDRRHDLAQHPGSGGDVRARGEGPRGIVGETGEMRQPARCQSRQRGGDGFVVGGAREARQQVEQGIGTVRRGPRAACTAPRSPASAGASRRRGETPRRARSCRCRRRRSRRRPADAKPPPRRARRAAAPSQVRARQRWETASQLTRSSGASTTGAMKM